MSRIIEKSEWHRWQPGWLLHLCSYAHHPPLCSHSTVKLREFFKHTHYITDIIKKYGCDFLYKKIYNGSMLCFTHNTRWPTTKNVGRKIYRLNVNSTTWHSLSRLHISVISVPPCGRWVTSVSQLQPSHGPPQTVKEPCTWESWWRDCHH